MTQATAPGKVILFGEHAVVYGRPAIAVPVTQVRATAIVEDGAPGEGIVLVAEDLRQRHIVGETPSESMYPLEVTLLNALEHLRLARPSQTSAALALKVTIRSTVPIGRGMGSGAAVSAALVKALAQHLGVYLTPSEVSDLVYKTEVLYHGTPSGIDNTVVSLEKPIYFRRGQPITTLTIGKPFQLVIADTGIFSPTKVAVADVRQAWQQQRDAYEAIFDTIGRIAEEAKAAIEQGDHPTIGWLMDENQALLQKLAVSSPELDRLVAAAREAGALGAKLCGAGRGGNMIALVAQDSQEDVVNALWRAGATNVLTTEVS